MPVALRALAMREEALRDNEMQIVLGARHRDIEQAAFLLDLGRCAGAKIGRNAAIDDVQHEDRFPFLALGGMDRRKDQIILVEQRHARLVARRVRRIERELRQEPLARGIAARDLLELQEIGAPHDGILVNALEMRFVPEARALEFGRPAGAAGVQVSDGRDKGRPVVAGAGRRGRIAERADGISRLRHVVEHALRRSRSDARHQLQHAEARDAIARVLDETQQRQHVLDVGGLQEFEAAELHEGNIAAGQFHFEGPTVMRGPEQDRLLLQRRTALAVLQDAFDDVAGLVGLVADADQMRAFGRIPVRPKILGEALGRQIDDAVGGREDRLRRTIIAIERDDLGGRTELTGEVEDVTDGRGAKRIDRLRVIPDDGEAASIGFQRQQDRRLEAVGVLIFVDEDMVEAAADIVGEARVAHSLRPVEQEIIVIEDVLPLLGLHIGREELAQLGRPGGAPGKEVFSTSSIASSAFTQRE